MKKRPGFKSPEKEAVMIKKSLSRTANLNAFLEQTDLSERDVIRGINRLVGRMTYSEQMELHGSLSPKAMERLYPLLDRLKLVNGAKEHVTWAFFKRKIDALHALDDGLFREMLEAYGKTRFLAIESLFVEMLKTDKLSMAQLRMAEGIFTGKAFIREAASFRSRHS